MPRTPLLRKFQALFEDFEEADRSGRTVEAVQEERLQMRLTRRDFLKVTGVTVGAAALGGPVAGIASTIYEASPRWGGRMHSDTTSWNGQTSEHCGELIDSRHKTILGLTTRFKLPTVDLLAAEPNQSTETDFFFGGYYTT